MSIVLLIEDHRDIAGLIAEHFESQGFDIDYAADGITGLHMLVTNAYDAVVVDVMLPGIDGITLCRKAREEARLSTPILMLTARDTLADKLGGFDARADDYLTKPFDIEELEARVKALIRRKRNDVANEVLRVGQLSMDTGTLEVTRAGRPVNVPGKSMRILKLLMRSYPRLVSRREIEQEIWGDMPPDSDSLRSHLYNLRKAIDRPFSAPMLHTVPNAGYRLSPEGG